MDPISKRMFMSAGQHGPIVLMYHSVTPGKSTPQWTWAVSHQSFCDQLDLLISHGWSTVRFSDLASLSNIPEKSVAITFDDGYADNYAAFEALKSRGMCATWFIVSKDIGSISSWSDPDSPNLPMLSVEQLHEMHNAGMEIGAHSRSHARLPQLNATDLADEVSGARDELSQAMGFSINSFAYPYGLFNDQVVDAVKDAGYKIACTTRSGWAMKNTDVLRIKRLSVYAQDDLSSFARKLAFIDNDASWGKLLKYAFSRLISRLRPH